MQASSSDLLNLSETLKFAVLYRGQRRVLLVTQTDKDWVEGVQLVLGHGGFDIDARLTVAGHVLKDAIRSKEVDLTTDFSKALTYLTCPDSERAKYFK